jgi:hypothetical protein
MNLKIKLALITGLFVASVFTIGCRGKQNPTDIGLSCQRLSSCYINYGNQLQDMQVKKQVEDAQKSGDENQCQVAIQQLQTSVKQECAF